MIVPVHLKEVTFFQSYMSLSTFLGWPENRRVCKKYNQVNQIFDPTFLNSLLPNAPFWSPWKPLKTYGFLIFSGGIKREPFLFWCFQRGSKGNIGKKKIKERPVVGTSYIKLILNSRKINRKVGLLSSLHPLDWNSPCRGEGASHQEVSTEVRQREELNWASQLKSSDQQIFSTMSGTDSLLIRQD